MLYYVPLEILEERYTASMDSLLRRGFNAAEIEFTTIGGRVLSSKIELGAFLDFAGTNYFKSTQIQKISELFFKGVVKDGDVFFFSDLWFPGIDSIPYMSRLLGIDTKVIGVMHAGSWTPTDFVSTHLRDYCKYIETGWFKFFDQVYVGSYHHKTEILTGLRETLPTRDLGNIKKRIYVTGLPFDYDYVLSFRTPNEKLRQVVFPHRFHWEKGADTFLDMVEHVSSRDRGTRFVITSGRPGILPLADKEEILNRYKALKERLGSQLVYLSGLNKAEFYSILSQSRVVWSSAWQENFGYSVLEACTLGVTPVLVNRASYTEFYPTRYWYDTLEEGFDKVLKFLVNPDPLEVVYTQQFDGANRIIGYVKGLCNVGFGH